jgi:uncharacterized surface protein with fasciclin (FAS1) repeats
MNVFPAIVFLLLQAIFSEGNILRENSQIVLDEKDSFATRALKKNGSPSPKGERGKASGKKGGRASKKSEKNGNLKSCSGGAIPTTSIAEIASSSSDFDTLVAALGLTGLDGVLAGDGEFTVFAPTDDAFADLDSNILSRLLDPEFAFHLADVLLFHVVAGTTVCSSSIEKNQRITMGNDEKTRILIRRGIFIRSSPRIGDLRSEIVATDVDASNGVIHIIDAVLPPQWLFQDLFDILVFEKFSVLTSLISAAGLESTVRDDNTVLTILAPTDNAFESLPASLIECLSANPAILTDILTYHVIAGVVHSSSLSGNADVTTLQGDTVSITGSNGGVTINGDTRVLEADVFAFNGLIHGIDNVLTFRGFTCP